MSFPVQFIFAIIEQVSDYETDHNTFALTIPPHL